MAAIPEAKDCFVLIIQGAQPWAGVVEEIEGVTEALVRILWTDPQQMLLQDVAAALASLKAPRPGPRTDQVTAGLTGTGGSGTKVARSSCSV